MISNHSQGSSGFLLGWADEGVRPYVVRAAACVGAGALTRPAERSSATSFRDCCRAALGLDGRDARPHTGRAGPYARARLCLCGGGALSRLAGSENLPHMACQLRRPLNQLQELIRLIIR